MKIHFNKQYIFVRGGGIRRSYSGGVKYESAGGLISGIRNVWAQDNIRRHLPFTKKFQALMMSQHGDRG